MKTEDLIMARSTMLHVRAARFDFVDALIDDLEKARQAATFC